MSDLLKQVMKSEQKKTDEENLEEQDLEEEVDKFDVEEEQGMIGKTTGKESPIDFQLYLPLLEYVGNTPVYFSQSTNNIIFLCIHGAGLCGASFALLSSKIKPFAGLVTFDLPMHGNNKNYSDETELSMESLVNLTLLIIKYLTEKFPEDSIVLLGHSLGGSIASSVVHHIFNTNQTNFLTIKRHIVGLIVVDVVEGSAIDALPFMKNMVMSRPKKFKTIENAIAYTIQSRTVSNLHSAKLSIPPLFKLNNGVWEWKTDLLKTEKYWENWFKHLNKGFLECNLSKILVLAHVDRMDKELTIAQMQGKFKLVCFTSVVGHCVHEDDPEQMTSTIKSFLKQFRVPLSMADVEKIEKFGITKFDNGL